MGMPNSGSRNMPRIRLERVFSELWAKMLGSRNMVRTPQGGETSELWATQRWGHKICLEYVWEAYLASCLQNNAGITRNSENSCKER